MKTQIIINIMSSNVPKYHHDVEVIISKGNNINKYKVTSTKRRLHTIVEDSLFKSINYEKLEQLGDIIFKDQKTKPLTNKFCCDKIKTI